MCILDNNAGDNSFKEKTLWIDNTRQIVVKNESGN